VFVDDLPNPIGQRQIPQSQPLRLGVVGHNHHSSSWYARGMYTSDTIFMRYLT
jgi:hypothetical protein